ncbi:MAG: class I SAM-dependent methyltransferase [Acidobacteriota bacterium]|nr:class I SAM-dependent methyltransferase [Acidobacteriota bacterium]
MSESYDAFAYAYDQALGQRFFRAARRILTKILDRFPAKKKTHLDVACGTGLAIDFFTRRGFRSTGVDLSLPMLRLARRRARHRIGGDMRALPLRAKFARVTCLYDSLNHLKSVNDLRTTFSSIAGVMDDEGLLLFDVNHPDIYPAIWGNDDPFIADGRNYHLEMATKYRSRDRIAQAMVTGWAQLPTGGRIDIHERREQRAYSEREIVDALASAALVPMEVMEFDPYAEGRRVKLFFVCQHC